MARGSIVKRQLKKPKNGITSTYSIVYYIGKKQKWEVVGPNRKEAERILAKRVSDVNSGTFFQPSKTTFNDFAPKWLDIKRNRIKPSTFREYSKDITRHLNPTLGEEYLSHITRGEGREAISKD